MVQAAFAEEILLPEIAEEEALMPDQSDYNRLAERVTKAEAKLSNVDKLVTALAQRGQELASSVNRLEVSVGEIKTELRIWTRIIGAAGLACLGALGWCYHLGNEVSAIRQALKDGGNTEIVAQLKAPKSADQLRANLSTVIAQVQTARADGKNPDDKKLAALSGALSQVVQNNPTVLEAWQAAAQLVDYKFQPQNPPSSLPDCLNSVTNTTQETTEIQVRKPDGTVTYSYAPPLRDPPHSSSLVIASNCVLNLDSNEDFFSTQAGRFFRQDANRTPPAQSFILYVVNAHIKYSGGPIIPINELRFKNCSFEITPRPSIPDRTGQVITKKLLASESPSGTIQLPPPNPAG